MEEKVVVLGKSDGMMTEVVSGLEDGDKVMAKYKNGSGTT